MDWDNAKELGRLWFTKIAVFVLYQNIVLYLVACVSIGEPIGLARYVAFLHNMLTFR